MVDYRADFYSLGVLIYHLITSGQYPFTAQTPLELYAQVVNNPPTPPTRHNGSISSEFENLILTLLSKQPYERNFKHAELVEAIRATPLHIPADVDRIVATGPVPYEKRCLFRLLQGERGDVERFVRTGGSIDGIEYPANFLPRHRKSFATFRDLGLRCLLDPVTYRLPYSTFALTKGLVKLPYVLDPNSVLTPRQLRPLDRQQAYTRACIDWQLQWDCSTLVAPFHFCRDLGSDWVDIDIKLIEESVAYAKTIRDAPPVYAGLCLNIEAYTVADNRLALLNRYSRARVDGYLFYVDSIDERTNNPLQLHALLDLLQLFQRLGKPVFVCRVGTLGLGLLAAGIDGATTGIASLSSFSENNLLANRAVGYDNAPKYYVPQLMLTIPVPMAEDILSDRRKSHLRCDCQFCEGGSRNLSRVAKVHFLDRRTNEVTELNRLANTRERLAWFLGRVDSAIRACDSIRRQGIVNLKAGHYSHLRTWPQVFNLTQGVEP